MRVETIKDVPEDPTLTSAWNNLVRGMENPQVFFTHEWALASKRAFEQTLSPRVFLVYESDVLRGVAALAVKPGTPRDAFFLGSSTADYCDVVSLPQHRGAVMTAVLEEVRRLGFRNLLLSSVPSNSHTLSELSLAGSHARFHMTSRVAYESGLVNLGDSMQRSLLCEKLRGKQRERRGLKKLNMLGSVKLGSAAPGEADASLAPLVAAHLMRFAATGRTSPLIFPERRRFLRELTRQLDRAGWLEISRLEVNGDPIAWNYGFRFCESWFWYLPTFRMEYEEFSPGSCLLRLLVEEACTDTRIQRVDLGIGDESYKARFADALLQTRDFHLCASLKRHVVVSARYGITDIAALHPQAKQKVLAGRESLKKLIGLVERNGWAGAVREAGRRAIRPLISRDEVRFFAAPETVTPVDSSLELVQLTPELLGQALAHYAGDPETIQYLTRCARRLKHIKSSGLVLRRNGCPVHFIWTQKSEKFYVTEIEAEIPQSNSEASVVIFDCWTPLSQRGKSYFTAAISIFSAQATKRGERACIFASSQNLPSLRAIAKANFEYRFSLVRLRSWGRSRVRSSAGAA